MGTTSGARRLSLNFRFRPGSSDLDSRGQRDVARLIAVLHSQRDPQVELLGFSDNQGGGDINVAISRERAQRVAQSLEGYGVHPSVIEGLGAQMPIASNDSAGGRERNRRVEVWIK